MAGPEREPVNRRIVLARRPEGPLTRDCFDLVTEALPSPAEGEVLLRTEFLSLDPHVRNRIGDDPFYGSPVPVGGVIDGQAVSRVVHSCNENYAEGDLVVSDGGWQAWSVSDGSDLFRVPSDLEDPALALGALGVSGFTAYIGLLEVGRPRAGETVVVSAATGGVGSVVGQIARMIGCRVVGIAGSAEKCRYAVEALGFDRCVNRCDDDFAAELGQACPDGIDLYFESVGGAVLEAVLPLLNVGARVPVCGLIAHYDTGFSSPGPDRAPRLLAALIVKRIRMQGFLILDYYESSFEEFGHAMSEWLRTGKIRYRNNVIDGLEAAPDAFIGLLEGRNFGKLIIRVGQH